MKTTSETICEIVLFARSRLIEISPEIACHKVSLDVWSKQEILGHLIDSALINHQRFVRGALNTAENFPTYQQNQWVEIQGYNERNWGDLVDLWVQCNLHLCQMLDRLPEEALTNPCKIGKETPATLEFVIKDYSRHLKMHLEQILET